MDDPREQRRRVERADVARAAADELASFVAEAGGSPPDTKFTYADGRSVVLPPRAIELLVQALEAMGDGHEPSIVPMAREVSTGEVAALLGVSRQYVTRLLDDGRIPFRRVGNRRRVLLEDALRHLRTDDARRRRRLRAIAD